VTARAGDARPTVTVKAASCRNLNADFTIDPFQSTQSAAAEAHTTICAPDFYALSLREPAPPRITGRLRLKGLIDPGLRFILPMTGIVVNCAKQPVSCGLKPKVRGLSDLSSEACPVMRGGAGSRKESA